MQTHELIEIPDWLMRKITYSGGMRQPKFERFVAPARYHYHPIGLPQNHWDFKPYPQKVNGRDNWLQNGDFRYWGGTPAERLGGPISYCRVCGTICWTKDERKAHRKAGCGRLMEKACKFIKRDKVCVICGKPTSKKVFGFSFCCTECVDAFKFYQHQPSLLRDALKAVEAQ